MSISIRSIALLTLLKLVKGLYSHSPRARLHHAQSRHHALCSTAPYNAFSDVHEKSESEK